MAEEVTLRVPSLAVTVLDPAVFNVTEKAFVPLVSVDGDGSTALVSLEVIVTVPAYPVAVFPEASFAVTVTEKLEPAVALPGTELKTRDVALPGLMVTLALFETETEEIVAPKVTDPLVAAVNVEV